MNTRLLLGAAVVVAAVPAIIGLWGNASFSQQLPVRVPASGQVVRMDPTPTPPVAGVDDHGGQTPRDQRTEPGDDRGVHGATTAPGAGEPGDDKGGATGSGGSDDPVGHDVTDDHGGTGSTSSSGSSSSGSDSHGSGHGSDD